MLDDLTDEDYFAHLKELFKSPGWQIYLAELTDLAHQLNNIQDVTSAEDLWKRRGTLDQIGRSLNYEDTIRRAEEDANDESPE